MCIEDIVFTLWSNQCAIPHSITVLKLSMRLMGRKLKNMRDVGVEKMGSLSIWWDFMELIYNFKGFWHLILKNFLWNIYHIPERSAEPIPIAFHTFFIVLWIYALNFKNFCKEIHETRKLLNINDFKWVENYFCKLFDE